MTMDIFVLSRRRLNSIEQWQAAIQAEGFDLLLSTESPFLDLQGHLPAYWRGREAGFECAHGTLDELFSTYDQFDFGEGWTYLLCFYWGRLYACVGASIAGAAYARATDGIMFDPQEGKLMSPDEAVRIAREAEVEIPRLEREFAERDRLRAQRNRNS